MKSRAHSGFLLLVVVPAYLVAGQAVSELSAQAVGVVAGQVVEENTGRPVPEAKVTVHGTQIETQTDGEGRFRLTDVPLGEVNLRLAHPKYVALVERVAVLPGRVTEARFELAGIAYILEALIVEGRPDRTHEIDATSTKSTTEAVAELAPGVQVLQTTGQVGSGSRLLVRGIKSLTLTSEPVIYVDGVLVAGPSSMPMSERSGVIRASVLDHIVPASIERVEILRGPAASARYGPEARNGVILIYTKRGGGRRPR